MKHNFSNFFKNKKILVTGGTGSIGSIIVSHLLKYKPAVVRILSRDTTKQIELKNALGDPKRARFIIGDIRDMDRLLMALEDINIVFHSAAFKHIPQGEYNPLEVIKTNVIGTQNLISAALKIQSITHFINISTTEAVQSVNTMGASKLLCERLVTATHYMKGKKNKLFTTVRLSNILGTSGSVLNVFRQQIEKREILLTHPDMVRYFLIIEDAVKFIFDATMLAHGGDIFVPKAQPIAIKDLAEVYARHHSNQKISISSATMRVGEKIHHALLTPQEAYTCLETKKMFIILPNVETENIYRKNYSYPGTKPLSSVAYTTTNAKVLSQKEILSLLKRGSLINDLYEKSTGNEKK